MSHLLLLLILLLVNMDHVVPQTTLDVSTSSSILEPSTDHAPKNETMQTRHYSVPTPEVTQTTMDADLQLERVLATTNSSITKGTNMVRSTAGPRKVINPFAIINQGIMSVKQKELISLVISTYLLPIFLLFGLLGNSFNIYVLVKERLMLRKYLLALSVSDTLFLITGVLYWISKVVGLTDPVLGSSIQAVMFPQINVYVNVAAGALSSQYTFLLTAERFVAVFTPLKAKSGLLTRRAGNIVLTSGVFTCLFLIPQLLKYRIVYGLDRTYKRMRYMITQTNTLLENKELFQGFSMTYAMIYSVGLPMIIFVLSVGIGCLLRKAMKIKSKMTSLGGGVNKANQDATKIVLAIATSYLVCYVPASIAFLVNLTYPDFGNGRRQHYLYNAFLEIRFFLVVINCSLNFCFYVWFNGKFKERMKRVFWCLSNPAPSDGDTNAGTQVTTATGESHTNI